MVESYDVAYIVCCIAYNTTVEYAGSELLSFQIQDGRPFVENPERNQNVARKRNRVEHLCSSTEISVARVHKQEQPNYHTFQCGMWRGRCVGIVRASPSPRRCKG